ncbi:hypothetical protein BN946_scf184971.g10 [Trametes cinnabarina]|uniref:Uncharacterized protein n=1 Tax=Pycnoporus cinnabarinus TaxID=5643 RepID=A0A060SUA4_PYCCI|nr:hypothetical protein BN946_scf184971.g10 [Trametes cinnabarina]
MSSKTVSQSTTDLNHLATTASTLRRLVCDNEVKIGAVDEFTYSSFRTQWVSNRDAYFGVVDNSDTSASKLAGTINYYLSTLGDVKDADTEGEMIEELSALGIKLSGLNFDQSADISALKSSFQDIAEKLSAAFEERDAAVRTDLEAAQAEVSALKQQLDEYVMQPSVAMRIHSDIDALDRINAQIRKADEEEADKATSAAKGTVGGLLSRKKDPKADETLSAAEKAKQAKDKKAQETADAKAGLQQTAGKVIAGLFAGKDAATARRREIQEKLTVAEAKLQRATAAMREAKGINIDAILQAEKSIEKTLDKLEEQLQLNDEVAKYLAAFEAVQADPSPENQRALANMHKKTALMSAQWRQVATLLSDVYAKKQK